MAGGQITVSVRFFAIVRERVGCERELVDLAPGATVEDLWGQLISRHGVLKDLRPHLRVAVNLDFVDPTYPLNDGAEVAVIPPVAGGVGRARITEAPLDVERLASGVRTDGHGAVVTFVGVVRDNSRGRAVSYLEYEVYHDMAIAKIEAILSELDTKWPSCAVAVEHRHGRLQVGDAAVAIAVASPHRKAAFEACEYVIDRLKEDVPIWKREVGPDGEEWVGMGS